MFRCFRSCRSFALHRGDGACATAHEWDRAIGDLKHTVRLAPQLYVKPVVKRQKNDAADAQAIAEAASRFVAAKTEQQARAMIFRMRDLLVRQPTQLINALRGRLAEHGIVAAQGPANVKPLADAIDGIQALLLAIVRDLAVFISNNRASRWEDHRSRKETAPRGGTEQDGRPHAERARG